MSLYDKIGIGDVEALPYKEQEFAEAISTLAIQREEEKAIQHKWPNVKIINS